MDAGTTRKRPTIDRAAVLAAFGANAEATEEVLRYTSREHYPRKEDRQEPSALKLPDEPFVQIWAGYLREAKRCGVWQTLRQKLIQLCFDVRPGQSRAFDYLEATRRGVWPTRGTGLKLSRPEALVLHLHLTAAGRVPVLYTPHRADFVKLTQALAHRNEPWPVPETQRATFVAAYNRWDDLRTAAAADGPGSSDGARETAALCCSGKSRRQDAIILLGGGAYSAVPASQLGLADEEWERLSLIIRREHECTHYVVRRFLGELSRKADDELLADFAGLTAASGRYSAKWALCFLGLEDLSCYRRGGRLENYRHCPPAPPLSEAAFALLASLVRRAAQQLEGVLAASGADLRDSQERTRWLLTLSTFTLEELAAPAVSAWLVATLGRQNASSERRGGSARWRPASTS